MAGSTKKLQQHIGIYGKGTKLQLPLTALSEEFDVTKVRQLVMIRNSSDDKVSKTGVKIRTGRKLMESRHSSN
jgi:hypothetical protein